MNVVPIVFAFDNNLILPACVCISSLMMNAKEDTFYDIFILHSIHVVLKKENLDKLPQNYKNCRIQYRQVDETFDSAFEIRGITTPAYYRLLIPELIPEYDKIIYSDVDVIFRFDLSALYTNTDLTNYYIAGVNSLSHLVPEYKHYYTEKLHLDPESIIYSGNLIINSRKITEDNLIPLFKEQARNNYKFQDMDILNIVCKGKILYLHPDFCLSTIICQASIYNHNVLLELWNQSEIENALKHGIVHYNGQKPWKQYSINFDIWWEYYRKSPFFDEKFYFDYFYYRLNIFDQLSLWKRIKILVRYFVYGKRII
ncbi:MAG: glycosyltransferase [Phocaeicola plebeius]